LVEFNNEAYPAISLLHGLEAATLDLLKDNNAIKSRGIMVLAENILLNAVVDLLNDAAKLTSSLQTQLAGDPKHHAKFIAKVKPLIKAKVEGTGKLAAEHIAKAIPAVLNLVVGNKIFSLEAAAGLANSFGLDIGLEVPTLADADIDALAIAGDAKVAGQFRTTIKALLKLKGSAPTANGSTLSGVIDALIDLLSGNAVIGKEAADNFSIYFMS